MVEDVRSNRNLGKVHIASRDCDCPVASMVCFETNMVVT